MKVLIVDDEVIIRSGLSTVIRWEENGFAPLAPAASAEEALLRIPIERPDIILTDIRMTGKSGIEMAREVKAAYPETEIIVISGFDEFAYAQQAMREGVSDYLLKTSRPDEILAAARKAGERLAKRRDAERLSQAQEETVRRSRLAKLLEGGGERASGDSADDGDLWRAFPKLRLEEGGERLQVWLLQLIGGGEAEEALAIGRLGERLERELPCVWLPWRDGLLLVVKLASRRDAMLAAELAIQRVCGLSGACAFVACGLPAARPSALKEAFDTAAEAARYRWLMPEAAIVRYGDVAGRAGMRGVCKDEEEAALSAVLRAGDAEALRAYVSERMHAIRQDPQATPATAQAYLHSLLVGASRWLERASASIGQERPQPAGSAVDPGLLASQPESTLLRQLERLMAQYRDMVAGTNPVRQAIVYIHDHLDQSLSLHQVARHVHMNPNYFSEMFKRETGTNYLEFVTQAKLRRAMMLLAETPAKVSEVASRIGYEDTKYFNRLFKKFTGQTPSEYRSNC
ncbi:response regulator [Paenibacillus methanolicus]|uniref:response regulator n=1 Tax=Paenibacillus methanolicus TaxID=582686 RepID=UPI0011E73EFC|nr:helix-turn-helix domain-containing protein [Paenibacillus methanolicus]